jgi:hypothetical protein
MSMTSSSTLLAVVYTPLSRFDLISDKSRASSGSMLHVSRSRQSVSEGENAHVKVGRDVHGHRVDCPQR